MHAEQYDRDLEDLFAVQDEITMHIASALQVELTDGEQAQVRHRSTNNLQAWGYAVKGYSLYERITKDDNAKARELFEKAIELDPEYAFQWERQGSMYKDPALIEQQIEDLLFENIYRSLVFRLFREMQKDADQYLTTWHGGDYTHMPDSCSSGNRSDV